MIIRLVAWSGRHPLIILLIAAVVATVSYFGQRSLTRDVLPDLSDPQIVLVAEWMDHSAPEVAAKVTQVLTGVLQGVPGSKAIRGQSMTGMAYLDVSFDSSAKLRAGRAEIAARVRKARDDLPSDARVLVGPEASSTGWVFQYAIVPPKKQGMVMSKPEIDDSPASEYKLRKFQDDVLKPALAAIPGVAEVASVGGQSEEVRVETSPARLYGAGIPFTDVVTAVRGKLQSGPNCTLQELEAAKVGPAGNLGPLGHRELEVRDVATVRVVPGMPSGMADVDGAQSMIAGIVIAKRDANISDLLTRVRSVIDQKRKQLPQGVKLGVLYDRSELAGKVQHTLMRAVGEEIVVVSLVVLLFLLHLRSALIPMLTLPLVVLLTFASMRIVGIPATVMSLGGIAIALGMAVDADLVALEACHRRLESTVGTEVRGRRAALIAGAATFAPAILTSLVIAALAFVPVFAFTGETGRLLRPLAVTKILVIGAAALVTLTLAPALRDRIVRGRIVPELSNPITRHLVRAYRPFVHFALSRPAFTLATASILALSCVPILMKLGGEFLPSIDEGSLLYMPTTAPGMSPNVAMNELSRQDEALAARPEVAYAFGKIGRADTATDPAPFSMTETIIRLKPPDEWPQVSCPRWYSSWAPSSLKRVLARIWPEQVPMTTAELVEDFDRKIRFAGWTNGWTAPIRARLDMMSTGVRTPVGVRIVTDDPKRLDSLGAAVRAAVLKIPGTKSATYESLGGETRLAFEPDAASMIRHHVVPADVRAIADLMITGGQVGEMSRPIEAKSNGRVSNQQAKNLPARLVSMNANAGSHHGHDGETVNSSEVEATHNNAQTQSDWPLRVRVSLDDTPWAPRPVDQLLREATVRGGTGVGQPVPSGLRDHETRRCSHGGRSHHERLPHVGSHPSPLHDVALPAAP